MTVDELEESMQRAAERRLAMANDSLFDEGDDLAPLELAGAYCGCDTCVVREVLDAAWPFMYRLAHEDGISAPDLP